MRKLLKMLSPVIGVILVAQLLGSQAVVFATPEAPVAPDTSATCVECDAAVTDLNAAYADFAVTRDEVAVYGAQIESLLAQTTEISYVGNTSEMVDHLTAEVVENHLLEGAACEDAENTFAYYSSFSYEGVLYCIENEAMWVGPDPYFNFLQHMGFMTEGSAPELSPQWYSVWDEMIELLMDHDGDLSANLTDEQINIDSFFDIFTNCDDLCTPDPEPCPDCDTIADNLEAAMDSLDALELEAEDLNDEVNTLEAEIAAVEDQFLELEQLRTDLRQMVEDAGGQTDEACDGFTPGSGQSWGVAHTFGDVAWCFTSEGQLEDFIQNLDTYWQTHKSSHLPTETELNAEMDALMADYLPALDALMDKLDEIDAQAAVVANLFADFADCLALLATREDCEDPSDGGWQDIFDEADAVEGWMPEVPETPVEEELPVEEEPIGPAFTDTDGHWADEYIGNLKAAEIVSGDGDTGLFRPNDEISSSEAAKLIVLARIYPAVIEENLPDTYTEIFTDVLSGHWFWTYVHQANTDEIFNGYEDETFAPINPILRAEAVAVIIRALDVEIPTYESYSFPDVTGEEWYAGYAEMAYQCGIMAGRDGNLVGEDNITRAEFSKIVDLALLQDLDVTTCSL